MQREEDISHYLWEERLKNDPNPPDFKALVPGQIADLLSLEI